MDGFIFFGPIKNTTRTLLLRDGSWVRRERVSCRGRREMGQKAREARSAHLRAQKKQKNRLDEQKISW